MLRNLIISDTARESTVEFPCLLSLDTLLPPREIDSQEKLPMAYLSLLSRAGLLLSRPCPSQVFLQLFFFIGLAELGFSTVEKDIEKFCKDEANRYGWSDATFKRKEAIELNNGRAAQMGIFGLVVHEKIDNNPYILNSLLGAPIAFNEVMPTPYGPGM